MAGPRPTELASTSTVAFATSDDIARALATKDATSLITVGLWTDLPQLGLVLAALASIERSAHVLVTAATPPAPGQHPLHDFINKYPTIDPIFSSWDLAHRVSLRSCPAPSLVRLASLNAQRGEPEFMRRLITQYSAQLQRTLNPGRNDITVAALKLLNLVVAFGSGRFARRTFEALSWTSKITCRLFKTRLQDKARDPLCRPDIRTLLVMLVLSFLSTHDPRLISQVLETRGLVSGMIKGLSDDPPPIVHHVLIALYRDVIVSRSVGLEIRRALLNEVNLNEIIKLYATAERNDERMEGLNGSSTPGGPRLDITVHTFLSAVVGWLGDQIDEAPGRSAGAQRTLGTLLIALRVTEDARQRDLALRVLRRAPNLVASYWAKFPASLDPRLSSRWISTITWAMQITSLPLPGGLSAESTLQTSYALVDSICPSALNRLWFTKAMQQNDPMVAYLSATLLLAVLQKAAHVLMHLAEIARQREEMESIGKWVSLARGIRLRLQTIVPDPQIIMALSTATPAPAASATLTARKKIKLRSGSGATPIASAESLPVETVAPTLLDQRRHLRNHIALRLLWMYHRVTPLLITTLRYDFGKLLHGPWYISGSPGIQTVTSGYALRVASLHTTSVGWVRPSEVFKSMLSPLLQRLRMTSADGNRVLLSMILTRVLRTPLLFGENLDEAGDWLEAVMQTTRDGVPADADAALAYFEDCVQKALAWSHTSGTTGPEPRTMTSPLLRVVQANLRQELEQSELSPAEAILRFVRIFFFSKLGSIESVQALEQLFAGFTASLMGLELVAAETTLRVFRECLLVVQGKVVGTRASRIDQSVAHEPSFDVTSLSPLTFDMFQQGFETVASRFPVSFFLLHLSPSLAQNAATLTFTLNTVRNARAWVAAIRVLLLRIAGSGSGLFAWMVVSIYEDCPNHVQRNRIQNLVSGSDIIIKALARSEEPGHLSAMLRLVPALFSPNNFYGQRTAMPYCQLIIGDAIAKSSARKLLLTSAPLVPFFEQSSLFLLTASLLSHIHNDVSSMDQWSRATVDAALHRCSSFSSTSVVRELWVRHFATLCSLAHLSPSAEGSQAVLLRGATFFSSYDRNEFTRLAPGTGFDTVESLLGRHGVDWTTNLLASVGTNRSCMVVLVQLVSRSSPARALFESFVASQARLDLLYAAPLRSVVYGPTAGVSIDKALSKVIVNWTQQLVSANDSTLTTIDDAASVIGRYAIQNNDLARSIVSILEGALPRSTDRVFDHRPVRFLSQLAHHMPAVQSILEEWINLSFNGIIRYIMENEEDDDHIRALVSELVRTINSHRTIAFKHHLFDPLITAVINRRLDQSDYNLLAATLCDLSYWKDQDVARHLNALLATPVFRSQSQDHAKAWCIQLIAALARASWAAAASCRLVDQLMPIYGGSTSAQDVVILQIFRRIELERAGSINSASKVWSPDPGDRTPDENRCAALHRIDQHLMRETWLRACASTMPRFIGAANSLAYDPAFLLPFVSHTIAEDDLTAADWGILLESGALGVPIAALASPSPGIRQLASSTLHTALSRSQACLFPEKDELALVLHMVRQCIYSVKGDAIPAVISLFLCCCVFALGSPTSTLYPAFMRFLLQRSKIDQRDVPMFYATLFASTELPEDDRKWLVQFLGHGLMRTQASLAAPGCDWRILRRRQSFELFVSLFESTQHDRSVREYILQFLLCAAKIPKVARELVARSALLVWITSVPLVDEVEQYLALHILGNIAQAFASRNNVDE
ncbi:BQ2448_5153 [Microbotryum intermedium]|uniref:BQ2448_5153 protein n=1 Tax=Microbotryum intermedium TaxID=269621 RepID=A0A238F090_9BASI|nr:BQ2448_5153 [Microbotryum intermedium]